MRMTSLVMLLAFAVFFSCPRDARADGPVTVRAAWIVTPASLIPILQAPPGIAQHEGKSYHFDPIHFANSATQISALASGDIDIATLNFTSIPSAVLNANLKDVRIILDETQDGIDHHESIKYAVLKTSSIHKIDDLKRKVLATIGIGTATDIAMRAVLVKHGLEYQRDYAEIEAHPPVATEMLLQHKADLISQAVPFDQLPSFVDNTRVMFTMKDAMGGAELSVWVARKEYIAKHRAALVDLLEDAIRAYHWYANAANHDAAVAILASILKQPPERLTNWAFTEKDFSRDPNGIPNMALMQRNVDLVQKLGFIKAHVDMAKYADLSLAKEAGKRLK
ncbi:MAG TPA: ABC transporter substrate-binding protein [Stellaceae bacterium]|jgi:sulfonate transport system substrate-binding protein|nr:ABC transporter substrate-binding protein [Stellaceae bacterium]